MGKGRVVVGWIPDLPVLASGAQAAETVAVVHRDAVVACSAAARAAGVRRRMRLRVAQARCPQLHVVERDLAAEMRVFEPVARHLEDTVMPRLEVIRPGMLAAPARGPSRYWGGERQLADRLVAAVAELGFPARADIADTVFTAALAARAGHIVPAGADAQWLAPYPVGGSPTKWGALGDGSQTLMVSHHRRDCFPARWSGTVRQQRADAPERIDAWQGRVGRPQSRPLTAARLPVPLVAFATVWLRAKVTNGRCVAGLAVAYADSWSSPPEPVEGWEIPPSSSLSSDG